MPPLAFIAIAFAVGVVCQQGLRPSGALVVVAAALSLGLVGVMWRVGRGFALALLGHVLLLGGLASSLAPPLTPLGLLAEGRGATPWRVTARVEEAPERARGDVHLLLALEEVERGGRAWEVHGRVRLRLGGEPLEPLLPGDRVLFRALLHEPRGLAQPDSPDPRRRLAERGIVAVAGVPDPSHVVRLAGQEKWSWSRWVAEKRRRLLAFVSAHLDGDRRALAESLLLGERGHVSVELDDVFRLAGVTHVLSVSGLHLAIAAFLFYVGLRKLMLRCEPLARRIDVRRIAALAALPATLFYTALTGAQVATVRSCIVAFVWMIGAACQRPPSARAALALGALVILGSSPLALYDPSFQLSFAAALGGIVLAPRIIAGRLAGPGWGRRLGRMALTIFAASLSATLATTPIAAWHFAQVAPAGLFANLAVVPLAELWVLPVGLTACALVPLWPWLAALLLQLAGMGAAAMAWVAKTTAALPGIALLRHVPPPTVVEAAFWYAALVLVAWQGRRVWRKALACLCIGALLLGARLVWPHVDPAVTVTFLDVGQGDACLVRLPDGTRILVDAGGAPNSSFDPGAQVIVPWLERQGIRHIDVLVMSHPHPDHAGGLASVAERLTIGEIWAERTAPIPAWLRLAEVARRRGIPVVKPHAIVEAGAQLDVLSDEKSEDMGARWSDNDSSIVLRLSYAGRAILLAGDVEARGERSLLDGGRRLHADVVKAPHHGSRTSSSADLIERTAPSWVVFSVGAGNRWGFPAPEVVARYRAVGAEVLRTDLDGAIVVRLDRRGGLSVERARARD